MGRAPCCDKANVKKGPWSPEEDAKLKSYIEQHGTGGNWISLPQKIGMKRCGKSCRLRWLNYLRPNLKHGGFSEEEDNIICSLYISIGSRWSIIAAQLPGRTDNDIKNYWNTRLKKKLLGKHRKESQEEARNRGNHNNGSVIVKQESNNHINRVSEYSLSFLVQENTTQQHSYFPMLSPSQPLQYTNQSFNDQDSVRKLLIKLGGTFSSDYDHSTTTTTFDGVNNLQFSNNASSSMEQSFQEQQVLNVGSFSSSACFANNVNNNEVQFVENGQYCGLDLVQGEEDYFIPSIEMVSTTSYSQRLGGLEFFNGEDMINDKLIGSSRTCGKSVHYGDTSTPIYHPLDSSYQG